MTYYPASWADIARRMRRQNGPASLAKKNPHGSFHQPPGQTATDLPHSSLVADPMASWGNALDQFHNWQISTGFDILQSGRAVETAADLENVHVAQESQGNHVTPSVAPVPPPPIAPAIVDKPWHVHPWNNPFSSVPGAIMPMGLHGPIKPPGMG